MGNLYSLSCICTKEGIFQYPAVQYWRLRCRHVPIILVRWTFAGCNSENIVLMDRFT